MIEHDPIFGGPDYATGESGEVVPKTRHDYRYPNAGIPPVKCSATSKQTGKQCGQWAVPGTVICHMHVLTGNTIEKARERTILAQLLARDPRHPHEVLLDQVHLADSLTEEAKLPLSEGETLTADQLDRLLQYSRYAATLTASAITSKAIELRKKQVHVDVEGIERMINAALQAAGISGYVPDMTKAQVDIYRRAMDALAYEAHCISSENKGEPPPPKPASLDGPVPSITDAPERPSLVEVQRENARLEELRTRVTQLEKDLAASREALRSIAADRDSAYDRLREVGRAGITADDLRDIVGVRGAPEAPEPKQRPQARLVGDPRNESPWRTDDLWVGRSVLDAPGD